MSIEIEVDGVQYAEVAAATVSAPRQRQPRVVRLALPEQQEFLARMENWRRVVRGAEKIGGGAQCCAAWARQYVRQRAGIADGGAPMPRPVACTAAEMDGWLVEAAWRQLGDANEREVLKALYIHQWPADQVRRFVRGVRGPHVPLLIAKAERNLRSILITLGSPATIQVTTCLPGCPEPSAEPALPLRRRVAV